MSYDYEPRERRRYTREEIRVVDREPRYADDNYLKPHPAGELVPRRREDSDLSVEEVRRDFPPPGYRDARRTRSAEPGYDDYRYDDRYDDRYGRDRDYDRDYDRRSKKSSSSKAYYDDDERGSRKRVLSNQEKIIAAVTGAALAFGSKELYDRYDAKQNGTTVERNYLNSAALGAAGAFAGYSGAGLYNKHATKEERQSQAMVHRGRDGELLIEPEEDKKSKNFMESALAATGLGAAMKAFTGGSGGSDDKRDGDTRSRGGGSPSRARSQSRAPAGNENMQKMQKAAMASLIAGATEAFRVAKEPGSWKGEKSKRIFTAAAGAAAVDSVQQRDNSKLGLAESVIGGLLGNRVINGSKSNIEEDKATGRSRSRSRARSRSRSGNDQGGSGVSGLAALATAGLGAIGAKKAIDHVRDNRDDSRGRSADSRDSRDGDRRQRSRSRSVVDSARKRLAKIGIGSDPEGDRDRDRDSRRDDSLYDDSRGSRRGGRYDDDPYDDYDRGHGRPRGELRDPRDARDPYDDDRSYASSRRRDRSRRRASSRSSAGSDSDLGDSDDDLKTSRRKRGDRRQY